MKFRLLAIAALLAIGIGTAHADEQVRRVQEELRKRNLYFGDINGKQTPEVVGAIRRYQERKGFEPNGNIDGPLLQSLNVGEPAVQSVAAQEEWPEVPVLKSDTAVAVQEADREYLEEVDLVASVETEDSSSQAVAAVESTTPEQAVKEFLRDFVELAGENDVAQEIAHYDDTVKYFDHGERTRDFIRDDITRYHKRWPKRKYEVAEAVKVTPQPDGTLQARFRLKFEVANDKQTVRGRTDNTFVLKDSEDGFRIVSMQEKRVP